MVNDPKDTQDRLLDQEHDGIQEYDNRLPNWWLWTLYGAIVFAFGYWFWFHTSDAGPSPQERYAADMQRAAEAQLAAMEGQEITDESLTLMSTVDSRVAAGREVFQQFCVVCHMEQGQGNVGPNLTDAYWLHGGRPTDIHNTVTNGVIEKGMAAWGNQLGPRRVLDVVAFVLTLKDTNVPGKEPQGELESETPDEPAGDAPTEPAGEPVTETDIQEGE
jgi:cytochrome c oxidase cbb3-type subunit 3